MGFQIPDLDTAYQSIRRSLGEIASPYNDGWTASHCKQELFQLKYWLDEQYKHLPTFSGEEQWHHQLEQQKILEILKK
jgi:hypothetical protein